MRPCDLQSSLLHLNLISCYSSSLPSSDHSHPFADPQQCWACSCIRNFALLFPWLGVLSPRYSQVLFCFLRIFAQMLLLSEAHPDHCIPSCVSSLFNPTLLTHLYCFNFSKAPADLLNTSVILFVLLPLGSEVH